MDYNLKSGEKKPYLSVNHFRNWQDLSDFQVLPFSILMKDWGPYVYIFLEAITALQAQSIWNIRN